MNFEKSLINAESLIGADGSIKPIELFIMSKQWGLFSVTRRLLSSLKEPERKGGQNYQEVKPESENVTSDFL